MSGNIDERNPIKMDNLDQLLVIFTRGSLRFSFTKSTSDKSSEQNGAMYCTSIDSYLFSSAYKNYVRNPQTVSFCFDLETFSTEEVYGTIFRLITECDLQMGTPIYVWERLNGVPTIRRVEFEIDSEGSLSLDLPEDEPNPNFMLESNISADAFIDYSDFTTLAIFTHSSDLEMFVNPWQASSNDIRYGGYCLLESFEEFDDWYSWDMPTVFCFDMETFYWTDVTDTVLDLLERSSLVENALIYLWLGEDATPKFQQLGIDLSDDDCITFYIKDEDAKPGFDLEVLPNPDKDDAEQEDEVAAWGRATEEFLGLYDEELD